MPFYGVSYWDLLLQMNYDPLSTMVTALIGIPHAHRINILFLILQDYLGPWHVIFRSWNALKIHPIPANPIWAFNHLPSQDLEEDNHSFLGRGLRGMTFSRCLQR